MILELPDREFGGYIFDCDGTLVDSMPLHFKAWAASFVHNNAPWVWDEDEFYAAAGVPDRDTVMKLNARHGANIDPDLVHEFKAEWYMEQMHDLKPVDAVAKLAHQYHAAGVPISVASGSDLSLVAPTVRHVARDIQRGPRCPTPLFPPCTSSEPDWQSPPAPMPPH